MNSETNNSETNNQPVIFHGDTLVFYNLLIISTEVLARIRNFESGLIRDICQLLGVKKTRTTPYHPESDGLVERFNRTLIDMLSMAVSDNERDWDLQLSTLLFAYRTSKHETTGTTPFFLMFGRDPWLPEDMMNSLPVRELYIRTSVLPGIEETVAASLCKSKGIFT